MIPQVLLGDILSDLPAVDNFELHERQEYGSDPQRVTQVPRGALGVFLGG